jgi:DegV family protein with EDD domain
MKIITDCAADMPADELNELNVWQAPLYIQFPEGERSSAELTPDQFYDSLDAMRPAIPTTAQPSGGMFAEIYKQGLEDGDSILSVHISSGLSGTSDAARLGRQLAGAEDRVTVWDTMTLSGGQRFQVLAAAWAVRAGLTLEQIEARLAELRAHTETIFTLETLEYLARGGRIGRVQALAGTLLHLKPVISVDHEDGKYNNLGRARTLPKALTSIAAHLHHLYGETPVWITVMHGRLPAQADALAGELQKVLQVAKIETLRVSPVLGVHTGPGVVGAAVAPMRLLEDLRASLA